MTWDGAALGVGRAARLRPGAALATTLLAALGTASFLSVFGVVNAIRYRALPVAKPQELVLLRWRSAAPPPPSLLTRSAGFTGTTIPYYIFRDLASECGRCAAVLGGEPLGVGPGRIAASYGGGRQALEGEAVVGDYFGGLGLVPSRGRFFPPGESKREVVVSWRLWSGLLGGNPNAVGSNLFLRGQAYTIVGVAPRAFGGIEGGREEDFWVPARAWGEAWTLSTQPTAWWIVALARAGRGQSAAAAGAEMTAIAAAALRDFDAHAAARGAPQFFATSGARGLNLLALLMPAYLSLLLAAGAAGALLAWSGLAFLTLWAAAADGLEYAIRRSLGAGGGEICLRAVLAAAPAAVLGAALGALAGWAAGRLLTSQMSSSVAQLGLTIPAFRLDARALAAITALAIGALVAGGLVPGLVAARSRDASRLMGRAATSRREGAATIAAAVVEVGIAFALVLACVALIGGAVRLMNFPVGFQSRRLVFAEVKWPPPPPGLSPRLAMRDQNQFTSDSLQLLDAVAAIPGVGRASFATITPFSDWDMPMPVTPAGATAPLITGINLVGPNYFSTMSVPILAGHAFSRADIVGGRPVAVVSRGLSARMGKGNVVGRGVTMFGRALTIIGVCGDVKYAAVTESMAEPRLYMPFSLWAGMAQNSPDGLVLDVRAAGPVAGIEGQLSRMRWRNLGLTKIRTGREQKAGVLPEELTLAHFGAAAGLLAFVLLGFVLYGFLAQALARRRREMAIRAALGCPLRTLVTGAARSVGWVLLAGAIFGLILTWWERAALRAWLHGVGPFDPWVLAFSVLVSGLAAAFALASALLPLRALELAKLLRE